MNGQLRRGDEWPTVVGMLSRAPLSRNPLRSDRRFASVTPGLAGIAP